MNYNELEIFYKFCVNRIDYSLFRKIMMDLYPGSEGYVEDKWPAFRDSPISFIVSRGEKDMTEVISKIIESENYKG